MTHYTIEKHSHAFAAWGAGRAASVKGSRFYVELGRKWLEAVGFTESFRADSLPNPEDTDEAHRVWRATIIEQAKKDAKGLAHGQAAKLISVYLKARFVCGGYHEHPSVAALHPPIDKPLLEQLGSREINFANKGLDWRRASRKGWSNLDCDAYQSLINALREGLEGEPFWKLEEYWPGHR